MTHSTTIETVEGIFLATFTERGLAQLAFPGRFAVPGNLGGAGGEVEGWHRLTAEALAQVLNGLPPSTLPPLDLHGGTDFQRSVWAALLRISPGSTRTYLDIARELSRPGGARAVGQACGANPIPVLIPCHRVLAANGGLGGFSCGLDWKIRLLRREGVSAMETLELQFSCA